MAEIGIARKGWPNRQVGCWVLRITCAASLIASSPALSEDGARSATAITNVETGQFDRGQYWETVRFSLTLPGELPIKACAFLHVDEAQREIYRFRGLTTDNRTVKGFILNKPSWDFSTTSQTVTEVTGPVGEMPMVVVGRSSLAYWLGYRDDYQLTEATLNGVRLQPEEIRLAATTYSAYSRYWGNQGFSFSFSGNEPQWVGSRETNSVYARLAYRGVERCLGSLTAAMQNSGQTETSPFSSTPSSPTRPPAARKPTMSMQDFYNRKMEE